jgi:hypothetical protein
MKRSERITLWLVLISMTLVTISQIGAAGEGSPLAVAVMVGALVVIAVVFVRLLKGARANRE